MLGLWNYWVVIVLMMMGLYTVISRNNLVKKVMGVAIFQVSIIMFYITIAKVRGGTAPIIPAGGSEGVTYTNPLPHVLMLTAIVVGVATSAVALTLAIRIKEAYGTVEEDQIVRLDHAEAESRQHG